MAEQFSIEHAMKAQAWERAKGELRAFVQVQGSYTGGRDGEAAWQRYDELETRVEALISKIEGEGLHE